MSLFVYQGAYGGDLLGHPSENPALHARLRPTTLDPVTDSCSHPAHADGPADLRAALRSAGLRATRARVAVLRCVSDADRPLSHSDVMDALASGDDWDRATIYRNLSDLAKAGLLQRYDLGDHVWRFELVVDPCAVESHDDAHHPHFMCVECGDVQCLPEVELRLGGLSGAPAAVRAQSVEVHLRGVCDACA